MIEMKKKGIDNLKSAMLRCKFKHSEIICLFLYLNALLHIKKEMQPPVQSSIGRCGEKRLCQRLLSDLCSCNFSPLEEGVVSNIVVSAAVYPHRKKTN